MEQEPIVNMNNIISKTFLWMFLGLLATGAVSVYTYYSGLLFNIILSGGMSVLLITELVVVFVFSLFFRKLPPTAAAILYFVYSVINGVSLSVIFACFEITSIAIVFFVAAAIFGIMAFLGYTTNRDLSKFGSICMCILLGGIIVSFINLFLGNSMINIIVDWVMLILFFGITAYDMNKIKSYAQSGMVDPEKAHIYGAMELYLDFINIFIRVLEIFGKRRD